MTTVPNSRRLWVTCCAAPPGAEVVGGLDRCELKEGSEDLQQVSIGSPAQGYAAARVFRCETCHVHALLLEHEAQEEPDALLES